MDLIRFPSYVTRFFYFHFLNLKFWSYEKLAMMLQFGLTRFYDVIISNSVFQLGNSRSLWWWPIIKLIALIHRCSTLISFEIVLGYWKLGIFQEIQVNLNGYWRNHISRTHPGTLKTESHEPCCGIIPKT